MIKKISQLNRLPEEFYDEALFPSAQEKELNRKKQETLFEVSYETADTSNVSRADEVNYYTSYSTTLSGLEKMLGVDKVKQLLSVIANGGLSVISGDLTLGQEGTELSTDRIEDNYYPDLTSTVTAYSKFDFNNDFVVHGRTEFHNNVVLTCTTDVNLTSNPILEVTGVAKFNQTIFGTAYRAQWGDLAEIYEADAKYEPGTLVEFGGDKEITVAKNKVNAVVTSNPAVVLNGKEGETMQHPTGIALVGRVPVKVRGPVKKFDNIVLSKTDPGVGVVYNYSLPYEIVGKALEDNPNAEDKLVLCATNMILR